MVWNDFRYSKVYEQGNAMPYCDQILKILKIYSIHYVEGLSGEDR